MDTLILPIATLLLSLLLIFIYFSKKRVNNFEIKIYSKMIIVNFLYSIMAIIIYAYAKLVGDNFIISLFQKIYMSLMLILIVFLVIYNFRILSVKKNISKIIDYIIISTLVVFIALIFITPLNVINHGNIIDGNGLSYNILIIAAAFYLIIISITSIIIFIKNNNNIVKNIPVISLIILYILGFILRTYCPSVIFETFLFTYMLFIMYFTIENPDLKMVNQLLRNKELVEDQIEDKSSFLFEMSQSVKRPAKNILELTKTYDKVEHEIDKNDVVRAIGENANELIFRTNNILDVSSMDASKIKVVTEEYNLNNLISEIEVLLKNRINDKKIDFNISVNKNVPNRLFGDSIRLKQVLMSILINAVENTNKGYVNLSIDSITRYDVARLIIKVEDTGLGMSIDKINEILSDSKELDVRNVEKIEKLDVDLPVAIKIIKLLNGNINIRSTEKLGTSVDVVIDQLYKFDDLSDIEKALEKYSSDVYGRKRILIVDDDKEEIFKIKDYLSKYNFDVNSSMIGKECIDRIRTGELYNLIIIDDELGNNSAINILNKLNEMKNKVPLIVMLDKDKEHFKKKYKDEGFKDYILKENLREEITRIINKTFPETIDKRK